MPSAPKIISKDYKDKKNIPIEEDYKKSPRIQKKKRKRTKP